MLTYFCTEITQAQVKGVGYFGVVFCNPESHGVTFSLVKFSGWFEVGNQVMCIVGQREDGRESEF